jgi:hypothetical protein
MRHLARPNNVLPCPEKPEIQAVYRFIVDFEIRRLVAISEFWSERGADANTSTTFDKRLPMHRVSTTHLARVAPSKISDELRRESARSL